MQAQRFIQTTSIVIIAWIAVPGAMVPHAAADAVPFQDFTTLEVIEGTRAEADRIRNAVLIEAETIGLEPFHAYSVWAAVFNDPQAGPPPDSVFWAASFTADENGEGQFQLILVEGFFNGEVSLDGPPLMDAQNAEIHLAIRHHGPAEFDNPDVLHAQLNTFDGSCDINNCANIQVAILNGDDVLADEKSSSPAALLQLQSDFHGAATNGDYDLMLSLFAEDAVVMAAGQVFNGPDEAADFFSSSPNWGVSASLAPTYKSRYFINGDTAVLRYECVIVNTGRLDPLFTSLSTIPFGGQNPEVEIVQHSTATFDAVRENDQWLIQTFTGSAGPPLP